MAVTTAGLLLALLSSVSWSTLDAVRKKLTEQMGVVAIVVVLSLGQGPLFGAWAALGDHHVELASYVPYGLASIAINVAANLLFVYAVKVSPLSLTVPFLAFAPIFAALIGIPLLDEMPTTMAWFGIALVVVGAFVLMHVKGLSLVRSLTHERGSALMVVVAALWATGTVVDKAALGHAATAIHGLVSTAGVGVVLFAWLALQRDLPSLRRARSSPGLSVMLVGSAAAAYGFQLLALPLIWVGVFEAVKRAVGLILSVVFGRVLFAESITAQKWLGIAIMVVGTVLVTLGS